MLKVGETIEIGDETRTFPKFDWEVIQWMLHKIKVEEGECFRRPIPAATFEESAGFEPSVSVSREPVDDYEISQHSADEVIYATAQDKPKRNKYDREIAPGVWVDVYDVLQAFEVTNSALAHLIKKALCVGIRGHKDASEDYQDIIDSAIRAKKLG